MYVCPSLCEITLYREVKPATDLTFKYASVCKNSYVKYCVDFLKTESTSLRLHQLY